MTEMQKSLGTWAGQRVVFPGVSELFGKRYAWLQDADGTIYTLRLDDNDVPQLF